MTKKLAFKLPEDNFPNFIFGLLVAFMLQYAIPLTAQEARFELFTTANGLAGNNTSTVTQDDQGFLWFVNSGKLHRFDGRNFVIYPPPDGFQEAQEPLMGLASCQDSLLLLWTEKFAFLFSPQTGNWQKVNIKVEQIQNDDLRFRHRCGQENILLPREKTGFGEIDILHFRNNQLESVIIPRYIANLNNWNFWCDIDESGTVFLVNQDTLYQLNPSGNAIGITPLNNICTDCYNLCFNFGQDGTLVLMANWNFFILDRANNKFIPHPANRFLKPGQSHLHRFILEDDGSIWACGLDRNLIYYNAAEDTVFNFHDQLVEFLPNQNDFKGLYKDRTGILWVDTRMGLLKVKQQHYPIERFFSGLNKYNAYSSFRGLTEGPQGNIYGIFYDGIAKFDPDNRKDQQILSLNKSPESFDIYADGNKIWVNGGRYLDIKSGFLKDVPSPFFENPVGDNGFFAKDMHGRLWWASHYYLLYLDRTESGDKWVLEIEMPEREFYKTDALHAGRQSGKLWISFKGKLLQYDPKTKAQRWFDPKDWGLPVSRIMVINEDQEGKLWLGTDAGLVYFDPTNKSTRRFTVKDGLANNFVCGLLTEGDSCLWLSTNNGLSRFDILGNTFTNFFQDDGLTYNEFNRKSYFKASNGRMFFGGMKGVNSFFPDKLMQAYQRKNQRSKLVLSAFEYIDEKRDTTIRNTLYKANSIISLNHYDWSYTFEFALTDYDSPEETLYSYQMEGYKNTWSAPSKFNFARFNSLPTGNYTFRVRARESTGSWNPNELSVRVIVHSPWWYTWWAYTLYSIFLVILIYFLRRYELNRQRLKYNLDLGKVEAERLKELDSFKSRLYTNLTHEFRTPLTVIIGMAGQIRDESARLIEKNGKTLLRLINQLLDLSKLENNSFKIDMKQGEIISYLRYLTESFQTYANSRNLSLRFFSPVESFVMDYDPELINHILINLISNAIKYTPSGGDVSVRISQDNGNLVIEVHDTGIGIAEKDLPHIFDRFYQVDGSITRSGEGTGIGLAHTHELVKVINGDISVKSTLGKGSSFIVSLPVKNEAPLQESNFEGENTSLPLKPLFAETSNLQDVEPLTGTDSTLPQLLIVEDNPDVVTYLRSILGKLFQLDIAYNGKIGIDKALENIPDIIISDVMMPEKDGYEVCDTLKNDEKTSHIPIILLTAKADAASRIAGLRRGADVYLSKPFDKEELLVQLNMLMERQKRMAAWFSRISVEASSGKTNKEDTEILPVAEQEETIRIENAFLKKVEEIIEANYADENFALPQMCQKIGMSRSQLFRKMKAVVNTSPSDFLRSFRLDQAKNLLETTDLNVSEVTYLVGYKDVAHFSRSYQEKFGFLPSETNR
jgi:signal transduction histidine kinase/DNA-binding response OmpR family regulator/ligand-binding sensor domain-containing protein